MGRDILYGLGAAVSSPVWGLSLLRTGKWRTDWAGRFGKVPVQAAVAGRRRLLLHAVSVGEVNLLRPLLTIFETRCPEVDLVIAATTNTGFDQARRLYGQRHAVVRFPMDFSGAVRRFLDAVRPDAAAMVELELWPNFVDACAARGIPVAVINGRLSARSFRGYRLARAVVGGMFRKVTVAGVQNRAYAERFRFMGVADVRVLDTMKWDAAEVADSVDGADGLAAAMGIDRDRPLVVAGSIAPGEELLLRDGLAEQVQVLVAPRKPEWFDKVAANLPAVVRRSACMGGRRTPEAATRFFLLDTIGELRAAYSLCDVAVVGRSFLGLHGSDVMEPAGLGRPVVVGPHHDDFQDTVDAMRAAGGLIVTDRPAGAVARLLADPAAAAALADAGRQVILSRRGAAARHADLLLHLLEPTV